MKRKQEDLTEAESQFLRSERAPEAIKRFTSRQHDSIGVRTSAYRKVAAAARAEREALMEVAALEVVRAAASNSVAAQGRVAELESERLSIAAQLEETQKRLRVATAMPALAVHAEGTGR